MFSPILFSIALRNVSKSFGANTVLSNVDLTIANGDKVGMVAPNGTGKSTLLRVIVGDETADSGTVRRSPENAAIGYLRQTRDRSDLSLRDYLRSATGIAAAEKAMHESAEGLARGAEGADVAYSEALDSYLRLGGPELDANIAASCEGIGLPSRLLDVEMANLSGGQAARAGLAAILLSRFDVYLLDEPTNDLDFDGLAMLEDFVKSRNDSAFVIVSHDRVFLERTVTSVAELHEHHHTLSLFNGGWSAYLHEREVERELAEERFKVYSGQKEQLEKRAREQRQWSTEGVKRETKNPKDHDVFQRGFRINKTEKLASKARATERAIERLDAVDKPWEGWRLQLEFEVDDRGGDVVASLSQAVIDRGDFSMGPIDVELRRADRLAVVGPNGSGKTTLVRAMFGELALTSGTAYFSKTAVVGNLDQQRSMFSTDASLLDVFMSRTGSSLSEARSMLAKFRLSTEEVKRSANSLSPGERTRAVLATISANKANVLVLDEPTNHLDLEAIEQLESALTSYKGTFVLVTHDRRLLEVVEPTSVLDLSKHDPRQEWR